MLMSNGRPKSLLKDLMQDLETGELKREERRVLNGRRWRMGRDFVLGEGAGAFPATLHTTTRLL